MPSTINKLLPGFIVLLGFIGLLIAARGHSEELLTANVVLQDEQQVPFSLSGESRENIINGQIKLGERVFLITKQSRLGLIGARRELTEAGPSGAEYAVFSSSFSNQTGVGQPWVSAATYVHCDQPYNSFLAVYLVNDSAALAKFGPTPYPILTEGRSAPDEAVVYCFTATPPDRP